MIPAEMKQPKPLVIRLRNFVGDVVLMVPTLQRLHDAGYDLRLVGKGWAGSLLAGHGWPVAAYAGTVTERVAQLARLRRAAEATDAGFSKRLNAITFPWSFSSALEMRLAGLRCLGHVHDGRSVLLKRSVHRSRSCHMMEVYWQLGNELLGHELSAPPWAELRVGAEQHALATRALRGQGVAPGYIVLSPFASTPEAQQARTWPPLRRFAAQTLPSFGRPIVICPGPGEEAVAARDFPGALRLEKLPLGTYAAVLQGAALVITGDTGPGHMAAAVGAPTLSLLGHTQPTRWGVLGPRARILRRHPAWPGEDEVLQTARELLLPLEASLSSPTDALVNAGE
jgi:heptosyltransferase II